MSRKSKKSKFLSKHRRLSVFVFVGLLLLVGIGWLLWGRSGTNGSTTSGSGATTKAKSGKTASGTYVNLSPPTEQDKQASNDTKNVAVQQNNTAPATATGKKQVTVYVSSGASTPIHAYVTGVFEDNGTCAATATNSATSKTVTNSSTGFENSSYTSCPPISLALTSGTWSVTVSYSSSDAEGSAQPISMQVQ